MERARLAISRFRRYPSSRQRRSSSVVVTAPPFCCDPSRAYRSRSPCATSARRTRNGYNASRFRRSRLTPYNNPDDIADRLAFVKGERWQGEEEYRLVAHDGSLGEDYALVNDHIVAFAPGDLTGSTFGLNIDPGHRQMLLDAIAVRSTPLQVFEAVEGAGFDIEVRPIS